MVPLCSSMEVSMWRRLVGLWGEDAKGFTRGRDHTDELLPLTPTLGE